jgi:hypothetical protein
VIPAQRLAFVLLAAGLAGGMAACTEESMAPGVCPDFCPGGSIDINDTIFTDIIVRDTAFRGYVQPYQAEFMAVADSPGVVDSRALFIMNTLLPTVAATATDTVPISVDSSRLRVIIARRDTGATNLVLKVYRLPNTVDSLSTFADLDPAFSAAAIDSVNVSDLLARPLIDDTATVRIWGDTIQTDSAGHTLQIAPSDSSLILFFDLDTLQVPYVAADSGKTTFGLRVSADSFASISVGTSANPLVDRDPLLRWFYHHTVPDTVSSQPDSVNFTSSQRGTVLHSFVFDPPNAALDDHLTVGGSASARSLLRVAVPPFLHDSIDVVRATLILVPAVPVQGVASDSFAVIARPLLTDLGRKSPLSTVTALNGITTVRPNAPDTVRIEISDLVRTWVADTTIATGFMLVPAPEGSTYSEIRFFSSRGAQRPALHVTYVKRFPFGVN